MTDPDIEALAAAPLDDADAAILQKAAQLFAQLDPMPDGLVERIRFGLTLDALHAEIAQLQRSGALAGVRSDAATDVQTVTFTSATLTTMVTITPLGGDRVRIDGWVAPGGGVAVELRAVDEVRHVVADADGRFVFPDVRSGFAQFVLRPPGAAPDRPIITPSLDL